MREASQVASEGEGRDAYCIAEGENSAGAHSGNSVSNAPAASVADETAPLSSRYAAASREGKAIGDLVHQGFDQ